MRHTAAALLAPLALAALAAPALAQFGPPPPPTKQSGPARVWNDEVYQFGYTILDADLGLGGNGAFTATLDPKTNQLCYMIEVPGLDDATAAHIHVGAAGQDGAPVVPLAAPTGGSGGGCVAVKPDVAKKLADNPGGYYVNIHTPAYPGGAVRGQLRADKA